MKMHIQTPWYKKYKFLLPVCVAVFLAAVVAGWFLWPKAAAAWYEGGAGTWGYRLAITVQSSEVDENLTDFPVYVDLSDMPASFFDSAQADGGDIRVTTADGSTEVPREIVSIDTVSDTGELHFNAPSLFSSVNTEFFIYYGNASAPDYTDTDTYGTHNVWSNGFEAVWHMNQGNIVDSTNNNNDGTDFGTSAAGGLVGAARQFNAAESDNIRVSDSPSLRVPMPMTVTALYQFTSVTGSFPRLYDKGVNGGSQYGYSHLYNVSGARHEGRYGPGVSGNITSTSTSTVTGAWETWAQVLESGSQEVFVNAASAGTSSFTDAIAYNTAEFRLGGATNNASTQHFTGLIDEMRIASTARSSGWIATEDNNLKSASTFYSVGSQEQDSPDIEPASGDITIQANSAGLVGYWSLGEGYEAKDRTPYENHGTINGAVLAADRQSHTAGAYSFDGNDCISIPIGGTNPELDITENLTISAWIKPGGDISNDQSIVRAGRTHDLRYAFFYSGSDERIKYHWYDGSSFRQVFSTSTAPQQEWNHVVAVKTAGNQVSFYINGEFSNSEPITNAPNSPQNMSIGATTCGVNQHFTGSIDDVRIYNRALSAEEVESLSNSYNPGLYIN